MKIKKLVVLPVAVLIGLLSMGPVFAAAPDGFGPWADSVILVNQALSKDGSAIPANRSSANSTLGVAESAGTEEDATSTPNTFLSLGFGGSIVLKFQNSIVNGAGSDLKVYEVTTVNYPDEKAIVEGSPNGTTWTVLGDTIRDGELELGSLACIQYVRITDISVNGNFVEASADAYDVDAAKALNSSNASCIPPAAWKGDVKIHVYWRTHDARFSSWGGKTWGWGPVRGDTCQNLANQALGFLNNWDLNPVYNGVTFQNAYFNSNGLSTNYDGKTMAEIKTAVDTTTCSDSSVGDLFALWEVLLSINNGRNIWY